MILRRKQRGRGAASLVEVLITTSVVAVVMSILASFIVYTARNFAAMANYADLEFASRNALDRVTSAVRQARNVKATGTTANNVEFVVGTNFSNLTLNYNPTKKELCLWESGNRTVQLKDCVFFHCQLDQRTPMGGQWAAFPNANNKPEEAKMIRLTWVCSKALFGTKLFNTEVVQTTRIVMRGDGF